MNFDKEKFDTELIHSDQKKSKKKNDDSFIWVAIAGIIVIGLIMYLNIKNNEE